MAGSVSYVPLGETMKVQMRSLFVLLLVLSLALFGENFAEAGQCSVRTGDPKDFDYEYFNRWNTLYVESERLEKTEAGKRYSAPMLEAHNSFFIAVEKKCEAEAKKSGQVIFMAIAVVSKSGLIEQYLTFPRKAEYQCFVDGIVGQHYPLPPADHYPVGFVVLFDNPIGTPDEDCIRKMFGPKIDKIWSSPNPAFKKDTPQATK